MPKRSPVSRHRGAGGRYRGLVGLVPAVLGAAGLPAASAAGALARSARVEPALVEVSARAALPAGTVRVGSVAHRATISFGLGLAGRNPAGLAAYAASVSTVGSSLYHHFLTPASFATRFGAPRRAVAALEATLRRAGLRVGRPSTNGLLLPVSGTAARVEATFHTSLDRYRMADGSLRWSQSSPAFLPARVASTVSAVVGLDSLSAPRSMLERAPSAAQRAAAGLAPSRVSSGALAAPLAPAGAARACPAATAAAVQGGGWTDQQLASAYGLDGLYRRGDLAQGQTIAVFELEPYLPSDLASFDRCYFGASHASQISVVRLDGFELTGSGSGEALLDLEDLQALAPAAKIIVYAAPNTTFGVVDAYNAIVSQDRAALVSTSWGECETALQQSAPQVQLLENTLFEEAAAQGQTVFAAAGDTGSDDCASTPFGSTSPALPYLSVDDPASQPYVVGVGGTSMLNDANPPSQTVWNDGAKWGGGGGGVSNTWPSPSWQADSGVAGVSRTLRRQVPDVSATADEWRGITVFSALFGNPPGGAARSSVSAPTPPAGWTTLGGTSSAAPIWAAVAAEIAASPACATLPLTNGTRSLGFLAPMLYAVAGDPASYRASFDQVTTGSNDVFGLGLGYRAHPGYNLAAGLGTPVVTDATGAGGLDASLCALAASPAPAPAVTALAPSDGPTTGGGVVTITGTGFPAGDPAALSVQFGDAPATVSAVPSSTTAVVNAPAAPMTSATPNPSDAAGAGPVQVSVSVLSRQGALTSRPGPGATYQYFAASSTGAALPTVSGVGPEGGNAAGRNTVTVYGTGFSAAVPPTVTFGGVPATGVQVLGWTELRAVVPPESAATACATGPGFAPAAACQVQVVVTDANGTSPTDRILPSLSGPVVFRGDGVIAANAVTEIAPAPTEYDYGPTPKITAVYPDPADATGQTPVIIAGSGFSLNTFEWVNFGPPGSVLSEQTQILDITPTQIVIVPPTANVAGAMPKRLRGGISVQTLAGRSASLRFSYGGTPTVTHLSELGGPSTGGTALRITGQGMSAVDVVEFQSQVQPTGFGASVSVQLSAVRGTSLTVRTPADLPGPVDVLACSATACSRPDPRADTFVYYSPARPSVSRVTHASGPASGGTLVTLFGNGLNGATGVRFGSVVSARLQAVPGFPDGDPFILAVSAPPGPAGRSVAIAVLSRAGTSAPVAGATFRYVPSGPSPPQHVALRVAGRTAAVSWRPPLSDGGSRVTGYTVVLLASNAGAESQSVGPSTDHVVFGGLAAGETYTVRVAADNRAHGQGLIAEAGPVRVHFSSDGYRISRSDGVVVGLGSLPGLGGIGGTPLSSPVVGIAGTSDGLGYWIVQRDGAVDAFGDATRLGYAHPAAPVVGIAPTSSDRGYWLVDAAGTVYAFGDARNDGSLATGRLARGATIVALVPAPGDDGYWLVASNGALFAFGKAHHLTPPPPAAVGAAPVVAAARAGGGLWLVTAAGRVLPLGGAQSEGSAAPGRSPVVAIASSADGRGYWLLHADGAVNGFGDAAAQSAVVLPAGVTATGIATT